MKFHALLSIVILLAVTASCASQPATTQIPETQATRSLLATKSAATASALSIITPSDDDLVSTDPTTFYLISGGLQLVEFFSFI